MIGKILGGILGGVTGGGKDKAGGAGPLGDILGPLLGGGKDKEGGGIGALLKKVLPIVTGLLGGMI